MAKFDSEQFFNKLKLGQSQGAVATLEPNQPEEPAPTPQPKKFNSDTFFANLKRIQPQTEPTQLPLLTGENVPDPYRKLGVTSWRPSTAEDPDYKAYLAEQKPQTGKLYDLAEQKPPEIRTDYLGRLKLATQEFRPDESATDKISRVFLTAIEPAVDVALAAGRPIQYWNLKALQGLTFNAPDILTAAITRIKPEWTQGRTLEEATLKAAEYDPSGFSKTVGDIVEFIGSLRTGYAIGAKAGLLGKTPKSIGILGRAAEAAKLGLISGTGKEVSATLAEIIDPQKDYGSEGAVGPMKDAAWLAGFSLTNSLVLSPILEKTAATKVGQRIIKAADRYLVRLSRRYPRILDKMRKAPNEQTLKMLKKNYVRPVKDIETGIMRYAQADPVTLSGQEKALLNHAARAIDTYHKRLYQVYMRHPTPDIVSRTEKPIARGLMLPAAQPSARPPVLQRTAMAEAKRPPMGKAPIAPIEIRPIKTVEEIEKPTKPIVFKGVTEKPKIVEKVTPEIAPEAKPRELNFTQFATEKGYPSDYDITDHSMLSPSGKVSKRAKDQAMKRLEERIRLNKQAHQEYREVILAGEIIDPEGKITKEGLLARQEEREAKKVEGRLAQIATQIRFLQDTGKGKRGIKPSYQKRINELEAESEKLTAKPPAAPVAKPAVEKRFEILNSRGQRYGGVFKSRDDAQQFLDKKISSAAGKIQFAIQKIPSEAKPAVEGKVLYHGTSDAKAEIIKQKGFELGVKGKTKSQLGISLTKSEDIATTHALMVKDGTVLPVRLSDDAKIYNINDVDSEILKRGFTTTTELIFDAKNKGFDGIDLASLEENGLIKGGRVGVKEQEVLVWNTNVLEQVAPVAKPAVEAEIAVPAEPVLLVPKASINTFLPRSEPKHTHLITKEGDFSNGRWLIKKEFAPAQVKERIAADPSDKHPAAKDLYPDAKTQTESMGIVGYSGELKLLPTYILRNSKGQEFAINKGYYDYLNKHIPDFGMKFGDEKTPATIYSGKKVAGIIMPVGMPDTGDITYITAKPAEVPTVVPEVKAPTTKPVAITPKEIAVPQPEVKPAKPKPIGIIKTKPEVTILPEVEQQQNKLRQQIGALKAVKGLTEKAISELKLKHTGYRHLTGTIAQKKITTEQLQNLLKAVQKARPKRVGYKRVITLKTENKIQSLKENLIKKAQMTETAFDEVLQKEIQGRQPKYIDAKNFITETQGKDIIRRMHNTAEVVRITEPYERAIRNRPDIAKETKALDQRAEKRPRRDPWSLESMRHYNQQSQRKTGAPIFLSYQDLIDTHLENSKTRTAALHTLTSGKFKKIAKDKKALQRVSDYIASQSKLKGRPEAPKNITPEEINLAKKIQDVLKEYRLKVRTAKFFNWYYYQQPIPDHDRYRKEITKATDIYESRGQDELIEYLKTQEWGVIKSGYEPLEVLFQRIRPYKMRPTTVGKSHIKIRTDIEYHPQERNVLQRLSSYMRQMDTLSNLSPKINAYVQLYDDNMDKFNKPDVVRENIETFLRNLKRYNIQRGLPERLVARLYSQAMRTIIMPSPVLAFRNLFQNAAFEHDKSILIDPRNKKLTDADMDYLETYVLQTRAMVEEYFMTGEKPLPGLKFITKLVDKVKIYPYSDIANRHWGFWAKKNQVNRALKSKTIPEMMRKARFKDMTELEQRRALAILAKDGEEAMARYVARVHVDDIHFLYERSQRSPAEMGSLGRAMTNLMLFPRAYGEKLTHAAVKLLSKKSNFTTRRRGLKILFAVIAGGMIVGSIYKKITGRRRNPYDPLELLSYEAGGLAWGAVETANDIYVNILGAAQGDSRAMAALSTAIPGAADMFIPFYAYVLRGIEAATDQKNIDRKAVRQLRMLIDKEYKIRGGAYKLERKAVEKWQYFIAGAGIDEKIKERQRKQKAQEKIPPI